MQYLYLTPPEHSVRSDEIFTIDLRLATHDRAISVAEGLLAYNPSEVEVVVVSMDDTIVSDWKLKPEFSNTHGTLAFASTMGEVGFRGDGSIARVTFRAKGDVNQPTTTTISYLNTVVEEHGTGMQLANEVPGSTIRINSQVMPQAEESIIVPTTITRVEPTPWPANGQLYYGSRYEMGNVPAQVATASVLSKPSLVFIAVAVILAVSLSLVIYIRIFRPLPRRLYRQQPRKIKVIMEEG